MKKWVGLGLVVLGVVSLVFGGIRYKDQDTVVDFGGIKATATEHKTIPISPIVGVISLVGGIALLLVDKRQT